MAPKQHRDWAVPKAKRSRAGDTWCLRNSDADISATSKPTLAVTNQPERIARCHRSEDDTGDVSHATLTMMNGDQLSYQLPLSVYEIKRRLPRLPAYTIYKIVHDTHVLEGSRVLYGIDYRLSVIVVKVAPSDWIVDMLAWICVECDD